MVAKSLRIVCFTVSTAGYKITSEWASARGHELALVVTTLGPRNGLADGCEQLLRFVGDTRCVHVVRRQIELFDSPQFTAADIFVCIGFPYRLASEIIAIPPLGSFNLHPALLPKYRGPNPARSIFDGNDTLAACLHLMDEDLDTGPIILSREVDMPSPATVETVGRAWNEVIRMTLSEGLDLALSGPPPVPQKTDGQGYAGPFTAQDQLLDWSLSAKEILRRHIALVLSGLRLVILIDGKSYIIEGLEVVISQPGSSLAPGNVIFCSEEIGIVKVRDACLRVRFEKSTASSC